MFSSLQKTNKTRIPADVLSDRMANARVQLAFAMQVCRMQYDGGRGFGFEHPGDATSWQEPCVLDMSGRAGVYIAKFDQCRFGLTSPAGEPLKKRTHVMTNVKEVLDELDGKFCNCLPNTHRRVSGYEMGVLVSKHSQVYPPPLVLALVDGFARGARVPLA